MNFGRAYSYAEGDGGNRSHAIYTARPTCWLSELCGSKAVESLPLCAVHRGGDISSRSPLPGGSLGYMVSLIARSCCPDLIVLSHSNTASENVQLRIIRRLRSSVLHVWIYMGEGIYSVVDRKILIAHRSTDSGMALMRECLHQNATYGTRTM